MASRKDHLFHKDSDEEVSNPSTSIPVFKQQDGNSDVGISCPVALESSEDDPLFKREKIKRPSRSYKTIVTSYDSTDILSNSHEQYQQNLGRRPTLWVDLFNRYQYFAMKFRNSYYIYIIQIWLTLLPFSAIMMGNIYGDSCPASPNLVNVSVLTGICGVLLAGQWMALGCCPADDRPCEGQQKYGILFFFILVSTMLELEIYLFSQLSHSFDPSASNYCSRAFYDYTYYKFIAAFASALLVVMLYMPGYPELASGVVCSDPLTTSCYQGMMEEDE